MPSELLVDAFAGVMSVEGGVQEGLEYVQDQVDPDWREQPDFISTPSVSPQGPALSTKLCQYMCLMVQSAEATDGVALPLVANQEKIQESPPWTARGDSESGGAHPSARAHPATPQAGARLRRLRHSE